MDKKRVTGVTAAVLLLVCMKATPSAPSCLSEAQSKTVAALRAVGTAVQSYFTDEGKYPAADSIESLSKVLQPDYLEVCPLADGWGSKLVYVVSGDGKRFRIVSGAADGVLDEKSKRIGSITGRMAPCGDVTTDIIWEDDRFVQLPGP